MAMIVLLLQFSQAGRGGVVAAAVGGDWGVGIPRGLEALCGSLGLGRRLAGLDAAPWQPVSRGQWRWMECL